MHFVLRTLGLFFFLLPFGLSEHAIVFTFLAYIFSIQKLDTKHSSYATKAMRTSFAQHIISSFSMPSTLTVHPSFAPKRQNSAYLDALAVNLYYAHNLPTARQRPCLRASRSLSPRVSGASGTHFFSFC